MSDDFDDDGLPTSAEGWDDLFDEAEEFYIKRIPGFAKMSDAAKITAMEAFEARAKKASAK